MATLTITSAVAVASESQRRTRVGAKCRSAIAPKNNGEMNAATADVANANGWMRCKPCASRINVNGTIHAASAIHWMKNNAPSLANSTLFSALGTRKGHTGRGKTQARLCRQ